ncbi:MAG: M28 family peptidase [Deltaproteobacteria bacterium]|nr:M28 family peptidase [Deltaproteobacteria bacterium]
MKPTSSVLALVAALLLAAPALLLGAGACAALKPPPRPIRPSTVEEYREILRALASDALEGRGVRTEGNKKAAELLARTFADSGLEPAGAEGGWMQCFDHPVETKVETLELSREGEGVATSKLGTAPFSVSAPFEGELYFVGYGIHAPDEGYSDYEGFDAAGKVLLMLRFEPREKDPESPLNGDRPSRHSELRRKVFEAKGRGAKAVIFVTPPEEGEEPDRKVARLSPTEAQSSAGLPVLHLLPAVADVWLTAAGTDLLSEVKAIDETFKSSPKSLGKVKGQVVLEREQRNLCNVLGRLPGKGALAEETVVIGAHFDHLGYGQSGTMSPGERAIHNGADDNASGAAALPILARRLRASEALAGAESHRSFVFAAFNGEEVGLAGSSHYVEAPVEKLSATNLMLNLDMIGRMKDDTLVVLGTESGTSIDGWTQEAATLAEVKLQTQGDGYGPSDQTPFYANGVPVLHFFTGAHEDYHSPSDDEPKIDYDGAEKVMVTVAGVALKAATAETRIAYRESTSGPTFSGDSRGFGAWLGTIPDYTAMSPGAAGGVKISGVNPSGPAKTAGLKGGDVIVSMGGRGVDNLYDMTFVLRDHKPGDVIEVIVKRGEEELTLAATLGDRSEKKGGGKHGGGHGAAAKEEESEAADDEEEAEEEDHTSHYVRKTKGASGQAVAEIADDAKMDPVTLLYPGEERHLKDVKQLTFEGENAEAYWAPDGKSLVFQARGGKVKCDRIYTYDLEKGKVKQVSSGKGRTTCAYYTFPEGKEIVYASTHEAGKECPPEPDHSQGYVWAIYPGYEIYLQGKRGKPVNLTKSPGYDAEATVCFADGRMVFTSTRDGDLDLYLMDPKHPEQAPTRLTSEPGYDGGAFFSPDCSKLVWRASRPEGDALIDYQILLRKNLVRPSRMEIYVGNADGSEARQITDNGAANFAPYFLPDNRRVLFSSNLGSSGHRNFDIFMIDSEADDPEATLERITHSPVFEAFPMFSPDGKQLVFSSNRNGKNEGDTNLFLATWVD